MEYWNDGALVSSEHFIIPIFQYSNIHGPTEYRNKEY
jgi:hypothetical protein